MNSCKGHIFISFPSMGTTFNTELNFSETVLQLIQKLLAPIGITDISIFNLYGYSTNFRKIPSSESCSCLFASEYEKFIILQSNIDEVDIYFENTHGYISYDKSMPASNLLETSSYCFGLTNDMEFCVLFDPIMNLLISINEPSTSSVLIVKRFYTVIPGKVFDFDHLSAFGKSGAKSFPIQEVPKIIFTKPMHRLFRILQENKNIPFDLCPLTPEQITKCSFSFTNEASISDLTHQEQISFLFALLSSGKDYLISPNLQQFAINAMKSPDDITKLEMVKVFLMYAPFSTHMILIELAQIYGGGYVNKAYHDKAISILTETIFKRNNNREIERKFISFMFLFSQYFFPLEKTSDSIICVCYDNKLVLFDTMPDNQMHAFTIDGPANINIDQTIPLNHDPQIKQLLDKYVSRGTVASSSNQEENANAAHECIEIYKRINQKLKENYPKEILYPFCEYLDELNFEDQKII